MPEASPITGAIQEAIAPVLDQIIDKEIAEYWNSPAFQEVLRQRVSGRVEGLLSRNEENDGSQIYSQVQIRNDRLIFADLLLQQLYLARQLLQLRHQVRELLLGLLIRPVDIFVRLENCLLQIHQRLIVAFMDLDEAF